MEWLEEVGLKIWDKIKDIGFDLLIIGLLILGAKIIIAIVSKITSNAIKKSEKMKDADKSRHVKTQMTLVHSINRYVVYVIAVFLCLKQIGLGEQVTSAVLAAGIGGLVISLGVQGIVKDMVAGLFLIFERQYDVGDFVKIGTYEGTVTSIALRVTYLKCKGQQVIIPNGDIRDVTNYSRNNSLALITIPTAYEADTAEIIELLKKTANEYYQGHLDLMSEKEPEVLGVSALSASSVDIMVKFETKPLKHWQVEREFKLLVKTVFDNKKISIPYDQITVHTVKK